MIDETSPIYKSGANANKAINDVKALPLAYEQIIDKLYEEHGKTDLELFSLFILKDDEFTNQQRAIDYAEKVLEKHEVETKLKSDQLALDVKRKKRQVKMFYPLLIGSFVTGAFGIYATYISLSEKKSNKETMTDLQKEVKYIQQSILELNQKRKDDSLHNPKIVTVSDTTKPR